MAADDPTRTRRRAVLICSALAACLAVPLPAINLALATPAARARVADRIADRIGRGVHLDGATLWPWSGITLTGLTVDQADPDPAIGPLAVIRRVRVEPHWSALMRGEFRVRAVEVVEPGFNVLLESLKPEIPSSLPPDEIYAIHRGPAPAPAKVTLADVPGKHAQPPTPAPPKKPPPPPAPPAAAPPPAGPTVWCRVEKASLRLRSMHHEAIDLQLTGLTGRIPLGGRKASSELSIENIRLGSESLASGLSTRLEWTPPFLEFKPLEIQLAGIRSSLNGAVQRSAGLPFDIRWQVPRQAVNETALPCGSRVRAENLSARGRLMGRMSSPGSWRGELRASSGPIAFQKPPHHTHFDYGQMVATLHGGLVRLHDARLVSDDATIIGNATALADQRFAAAFRLIAAPPRALVLASSLFPDLKAPIPLTPLSTPQRAAFDLEAHGDLNHVELTVGRNGPKVTLPHTQP